MKSFQQFLQKPWLYILIILAGISLKFYHLDYKLYWFDEICTIEHTAGRPLTEPIPENEIKPIGFYKDLMHLNKMEYSLISQLRGITKRVNLNPGHYIFLTLWHRIFGDSLISYRLYTVLCFILSIPFIFLLAGRLFQSDLAGWITASLFAVSPFIHLYSQEARYYMLWFLLLVAYHVLLLKLIKDQRFIWWILYSVLGIIALYISILTSLVLIGHLAYTWIFQKNFRIKHSLSLLIQLCFYIPWIFFLFQHANEVVGALKWHQYPYPFWGLITGQLLAYASMFCFWRDYSMKWEYVFLDMNGRLIFDLAILVLVILLIVIATIWTFRKTDKKNAFFIAFIFLPGFLYFFITDVVRHAIASYYFRYLILNTISIFLVVGGYLGYKIKRGKLVFSGILASLWLISLISVFTIASHRYWYLWGDYLKEYIQNAKYISQAEKPLIITDLFYATNPYGGGIYALSVFGDCQHVNIDILKSTPDNAKLGEQIYKPEYSNVYALYCSDELLDTLCQHYGFVLDSVSFEGTYGIWELKDTTNLHSIK